MLAWMASLALLREIKNESSAMLAWMASLALLREIKNESSAMLACHDCPMLRMRQRYTRNLGLVTKQTNLTDLNLTDQGVQAEIIKGSSSHTQIWTIKIFISS